MPTKHVYMRPIVHGGMIYVYADLIETFESKSPPLRTFGYEWYSADSIEIIGVARIAGEPAWGKEDYGAIAKAACSIGAKYFGYRRYDDGPDSERWVWFDSATGRRVRKP